MDITMSRVRLASDTCDIYFTYIKVNHLLYTCSLDPFEDGILLDTSPVCMHRYCRNLRDVEEECERKCTSTPSTRDAWKRRRKKGEEAGAAAEASPDIRTAVRIIRTQPDHSGPPPDHPDNCTKDTRRFILKPDHPDNGRIIQTPIRIIRALPACNVSGRGPCTHSPPHLPLRPLDYK
jgi:hypothetical protein